MGLRRLLPPPPQLASLRRPIDNWKAAGHYRSSLSHRASVFKVGRHQPPASLTIHQREYGGGCAKCARVCVCVKSRAGQGRHRHRHRHRHRPTHRHRHGHGLAHTHNTRHERRDEHCGTGSLAGCNWEGIGTGSFTVHSWEGHNGTGAVIIVPHNPFPLRTHTLHY